MTSVSILGLGRVGGALAIALDRARTPLIELIYRSESTSVEALRRFDPVPIESLASIRGDVLFIATADPDIRSAAEIVASLKDLPRVALHLSGLLASDELKPLKEKGVAIGSMHPLVSISDPELGPDRFAGAYFCVEGDAAAVTAAESIVNSLGGKHFTIDTHLKPLYHASAVMASGNVTALFDAAIEILSKCGLSSERSQEILLPLIQSTVANLAEQPTKTALTGPFVRGDIAALDRHLAAFTGVIDDDLRSIYLDLAERSVRLAGGDNAADLLAAISIAKRATGC